MRTNNLRIPLVQEIHGIGKKMAMHLAHLNIHNLMDVLLHFPHRYQDRTTPTPIKKLMLDCEQVCHGEIISVTYPTQGKTKILCEILDDNARLQLRFFHRYAAQQKILQIGNRVQCFAKVRYTNSGKEMFHPEIKLLDATYQPVPYYTAIYPTTEGLYQQTLRQLVAQALQWAASTQYLQEILPDDIVQHYDFPDFASALCSIHQPALQLSLEELNAKKSKFHKRIIFEELLIHKLTLLNIKSIFTKQESLTFQSKNELSKNLIAKLPFELTNAQQRVVTEIEKDLQKPNPMLRLLQGDVGSGKTLVAALAALVSIENGYQVALMAPTELLAEQHFRVLNNWFTPLNINLHLLTGSIKGAQRKQTLEALADHTAQMVVGTHALFQQEVKFHQLALIIIDEQHRFGVTQRAQLRAKGVQDNKHPHQLIMTATPIPRTLALSFYADLDCSILDELPPGRVPIVTRVLPSAKRQQIVERVRLAIKEKRQVYWVCPLIDESDEIQGEAATQVAIELQQMLPEVKVGLLHGKMPTQDKEKIMQQFQQQQIDLLVATTVIEVGVDVPNATVIIIENAERLGLAQLHQLRGRVGRGEHLSHCLLLYQPPLSEFSQARLSLMRDTTDGFKIAEQDLVLRGPGEFLGTRQTGDVHFKLADFLRDAALLPAVQQTAQQLYAQHTPIVEKLFARWRKLNDIGLS